MSHAKPQLSNAFYFKRKFCTRILYKNNNYAKVDSLQSLQKMWNDLPFELKSDSRISFNKFVKKVKEILRYKQQKYGGVFACSYSVIILIFMRLNLSVAAAISTLNARYDFLYSVFCIVNLKYLVILNLNLNWLIPLPCFLTIRHVNCCTVFSMYSIFVFFSFLHCLMYCIAEFFI